MAEELRFLNFVGGVGKADKVQRAGRSWTAVPVIALVEGAIRAMNAKEYELVPAECFSEAPEQWDGMPLQPGHPLKDGAPVSAKLPEFQALSFGHIEGTHVKGKQLRTMAWIDDEKAKANPKSARVLQRIEDGKMVEVSVGAYVGMRACEGETNGRKHKLAWSSLRPDHLAMLSDDQVGACSIAMGCGALRVNMFTDEGFKEIEGEEEMRAALGDGSNQHGIRYSGAGGVYDVRGDGELHSVYVGDKKINSHVSMGRAAKWAEDASLGVHLKAMSELRAAMPSGWSDTDVQQSLRDSLLRAEPLNHYLYVVAVYNESVVYAMGERTNTISTEPYPAVERLYRRPITFNKEKQAFDLGDRVEVESAMTYEPVPAARNASSVQELPEPRINAAIPCPCGGHKSPADAGQGDSMTKEARIAALMGNPHNKMTEEQLKGLSDEQLKALEGTVAAAAKTADDLRAAQEATTKAQETAVKTAADFQALDASFKALQTSAQPLIDAEVAKQAAEKTTLVESLKACQTVLTEEQLKAKTIDELRTFAALAKVAKPEAPEPNFAGAGMPRFASRGIDIAAFAPKDPYASLTAAK